MTDAIFESERLTLGWQRVTVLPPDLDDAREGLAAHADPIEQRIQPACVRGDRGERDVHIWRAERAFPILRSALTRVAEELGAGGHAFLEFFGEALERVLRDAKRSEALITDRDRQ